LPEPLVIPSGRACLAWVRDGVGGSPSVVFLHAGIADHRSWSGVLNELVPDIDVVAYDRRGFGTTTYEAEGHDQVVDLLAVLDATGISRAVLVGNSMGGRVALDFALTHPDRVSALVLVAPAVSGAPPVERENLHPDEAAFWDALEEVEARGDLQALNEGEIRLWLDGLPADERRVDDDRRGLALDMNRLALSSKSPGHEPSDLAAWPRLGEIGCPVLVVVGDLDLRHMQARARQLVTLLPNAALSVMPGTAHLPAFEQPATFAALLRSFLAEVPAAPA
jgi:pimeloyl-ACP methyl ester carboxylesterase